MASKLEGRVAGQMWLFEEIIELIVGKCLFTVRTRFGVIAEDGRMKGFFVHLYQREKFGATLPTSEHQLRHSSAMTRISYFNIKLSSPIEQSYEKINQNPHQFPSLSNARRIMFKSSLPQESCYYQSYYHSQIIKQSYLTGVSGNNCDIG